MADKDKIIELAALGQLDGDDHKTWVIDQILREVLGDTDYDQFVAGYEGEADEDGYTEWFWDTGVAP